MSSLEPVKALPPGWPALFATYRILSFGGRDIFHGQLRPDLAPDHPDVRELLDTWEGRTKVEEGPSGVHVVLQPPDPEPDRIPWLLHFALFAATLFTTLVAGALLQGMDPLAARPVSLGGVLVPVPTGVRFEALIEGWPFALPFLGILLGHEMGHYVAARFHDIRASLPYFIPFPPYYSVVGTLGAFIRLRSPTMNRAALLDVGAAGPIASFLLGIPVLWVGLSLSEIVPVGGGEFTPYLIEFAGQPIRVGEGALVRAVAHLSFGSEAGGNAILLHPTAFAGWLGLFVTFLNLLPFGQLDGGHIGYAVWARAQRIAGFLFLVLLIPLGFLWWGWWFWGGVAFLINRGRMSHPAVLFEDVEPSPWRKLVGWACFLILLLTFAPVPVSL